VVNLTGRFAPMPPNPICKALAKARLLCRLMLLDCYGIVFVIEHETEYHKTYVCKESRDVSLRSSDANKRTREANL
jgi:hypothetical protein